MKECKRKWEVTHEEFSVLCSLFYHCTCFGKHKKRSSTFIRKQCAAPISASDCLCAMYVLVCLSVDPFLRWPVYALELLCTIIQALSTRVLDYSTACNYKLQKGGKKLIYQSVISQRNYTSKANSLETRKSNS